jgi:hypothetical protein
MGITSLLVPVHCGVVARYVMAERGLVGLDMVEGFESLATTLRQGVSIEPFYLLHQLRASSVT